MAAGKDNVNGTGSKPKMNCATNERREVAMMSTSSMRDSLGWDYGNEDWLTFSARPQKVAGC
jgi:hypothetical protein